MTGIAPLSSQNSAPYDDASHKPVLKESLVAYFDELGTSQKIESLTQEELEGDLARYARLLWFLDGDDPSNERSAYVVNTFTDNVSVSRPFRAVNDDDELDALRLFLFLQGIAFYQANTVSTGTLLRGGISCGLAYARPGFVTGPAHLKAVKLEEKGDTRSPRIIVNEDVVRLIATFETDEEKALFEGVLCIDDDQQSYVNYLELTIREHDGGENDVRLALAEHRAVISAGLARFPASNSENSSEKSPPRVKYLWAAKYHNSVCTRLTHDDLKIAAREL